LALRVLNGAARAQQKAEAAKKTAKSDHAMKAGMSDGLIPAQG
jgi:hypothetical protein